MKLFTAVLVAVLIAALNQNPGNDTNHTKPSDSAEAEKYVYMEEGESYPRSAQEETKEDKGGQRPVQEETKAEAETSQGAKETRPAHEETKAETETSQGTEETRPAKEEMRPINAEEFATIALTGEEWLWDNWQIEDGYVMKEAETFTFAIPKNWITERADGRHFIYSMVEYGSTNLRLESYSWEEPYNSAQLCMKDLEEKYLEAFGFHVTKSLPRYQMNGYAAQKFFADYKYPNGTSIKADILILAREKDAIVIKILYPEKEAFRYYAEIESVIASIHPVKASEEPEETTASIETPASKETKAR